MKTQKLSITLYGLGLFTIFVFTYKYFIKSDFTGMWLVGLGIGCGALFGGYMYSWMKEIENRLDKSNERLNVFSKWFIKNKEF